MSDDKVIIDPEFRSSPGGGDGDHGRGPGRIDMVAVAVAALIFGGLLWSLPPSGPGPAATSIPPLTTTTSVPVDRASVAVQDVPLGEAAIGFTDTITTLAWGDDSVEILRWAASQPAPETMMWLDHARGGWNRGVDASGRWYSEIRGDFELTVRLVGGDDDEPGRASLFGQAVAGRVWSSLWHDTEPGRLALLTCPRTSASSPGTLHTYDAADGAAEPVARQSLDNPCGNPGVWLAGWGDWGTLLQTRDETGTIIQVLIDAEGTETARGSVGPGGVWFIAGGPDGTTIWTQDPRGARASSFLLSPDGRHRSPVPGLADDEWLDAARWSPDGSLLALSPFRFAADDPVVHIVESETGVVVTEIAEPGWRVSAMVWSTDGRFLIYERWPSVVSNWAGVPHDAEVVFHDTVTGTRVALPLPGYVAGIRTTTGHDPSS